jgi:hypothetical protein
MKTEYLTLGQFSNGTLLAHDIARAILDAFGGVHDNFLSAETAFDLQNVADQEEDVAEFADELIAEAMDELQEHAPPFCYVGSHEGDGACFGVWVSQDAIDDGVADGEIIRISDLSELDGAETDANYAVLVNDHGNLSLYTLTKRIDAEEVFAIV